LRVSLVSITKPCDGILETAEDLIAYCARVSNPSNQENTETAPGLIRYLIKNKHWSPFEMASMCVEIETSRAIAQQILRHRSFSFQEFSQRYSNVKELNEPFEPVELRYAADTNRQSSSDVVEDRIPIHLVDVYLDRSLELYNELIKRGIATESARFILPLTTKTRLYMNGSIRSWIHYFELRTDEHTQKEHRLLAEQTKNIFEQHFPNIYEALYGV
jgi:thymidylate synthase (FAD)